MAQPILSIWRPARFESHTYRALSRRYLPYSHRKPQTTPKHRHYNTSQSRREYPREGVFQANSPPRRTPHNQPQSNTYFPQQSPSSPHYSSEPPSQPPPRSYLSIFLSYGTRTLFFFGVLTFGFLYVTSEGLTRAPLPLTPGSEEDQEELKLLAEEHDNLPFVQDLRSLYRFDPATNERVRVWKEWVAYRGFIDPTSTSASVERREHMLSTGPLKGSQGLAAQTVFYNEENDQVMVLVNFGEGCCGWPGVVHGGAIATVMDEALGRVAAKSLAKYQPNSVADGPEDMAKGSSRAAKRSVVTASLDINYFEKVEPGQWFLLFAQLAEGTADPNSGESEQVVDRDSVERQAPTSFTGISGGRSQRGFNRTAPPSPPKKTSMNPIQASTPQSLGTRSDDAASKESSSDEGKDDSLPFRFKRSTDRKKFVGGVMICVSEFGPTLDDVSKVFLEEVSFTKDEPNPLGVHAHAIAKGLWIIKDGIAPPPDQF